MRFTIFWLRHRARSYDGFISLFDLVVLHWKGFRFIRVVEILGTSVFDPGTLSLLTSAILLFLWFSSLFLLFAVSIPLSGLK